jgi:uncharacterized damage-inducible protein DinB
MMIIDNQMLWRQYSAAIDSLREALRNCPDAIWTQPLWADEAEQWVAKGFGSFWYLCYHTLFWLDLYLTGAEEGFAPPAPFDLVEMRANETLPRVYTRDELLGYLELCRERYQATIGALTTEQAYQRCSFAWGDLPYGELLLYTLRHVVEHAAQLHLFLGQQAKRT